MSPQPLSGRVGGQRVQGTAGTERYFYFRLNPFAS